MGGASEIPGVEGAERLSKSGKFASWKAGEAGKVGDEQAWGVEEVRMARVRTRGGWGASTSSAQALVFPAESGRPHDFTAARGRSSYVKTSTS